jgi:hypothetical protein
MAEISIGISIRGNTFIHLHDMRALPWNVLESERTEHYPGSVSTTYRHNKAAAGGDGCTSLPRDNRGGPVCYGIGVGQEFNLHVILSPT